MERDLERDTSTMDGLPVESYGQGVKPKRAFTWVIIGWNVLMLVWLIAGLVNASHNDCSAATYQDACRTGAEAGTAIGVGFILFIAAVGDVILGVLWMVTRPTGDGPSGSRPCPHCAEMIQPAANVCRFCGRDVPQVKVDTRPVLFGRAITGSECANGHPGPVDARRCAVCRSPNVHYVFADEPAVP